jgi:hypothetical protein
MSYREENGQVILTMNPEDYERLLMCLGAATAMSALGRHVLTFNAVLEMMNRLNDGNPNWTPYQVEAK